MKKVKMQIAAFTLLIAVLFSFGFSLYLPLSGTGESVDNTEPLPEDNENNDVPENTPETEGGSDGNPPSNPSVPETDESVNTGNTAPTPDEDEKRKSQYIRSKVNGLSIRTGPGTSYTSIGSINQNDMVTYKGKSGDWYITEYKNKTAYISANASYTEIFAMSHEFDEKVEKVIDEGLKLLGFPYVYGAIRLHDGKGNLIKGFNAAEYDCSSLMQYMFYHGAGINLNMTTRTQVKQGTYVAKQDLKRGDLIFFTNSSRYNKTGVERIGHVALYLGDNYILHTASDYAVIEPVSSQRWYYYIETRRMF